MNANVLRAVKMKPGNQYQQKLPTKTYKKNRYREIRQPFAMGLARLCKVSNRAALAKVEGQICQYISKTSTGLSIAILPSQVAPR